MQDLLQAALRHQQSGQLREAEVLYKQILRADPNHPDALHFLGLIAQQVGKTDAAVWFMKRSLEIAPQNTVYHVNYAIVLEKLGRHEEALGLSRRAVELRPDFPEALATYGAMLAEIDPHAGIPYLRKALELDPRHLKARYNLANTLADIGNPSDAIREYEAVIAAAPDYANARFALSLVQLREGDFARGWEGYEWRWRTDHPSIQKREFDAPLWDGSDPAGKTILLYCEQGYGDAIQFVRYAPLLAERGARVIIEALPGLVKLFRGIAGMQEVIAAGDTLPPHDLRCPIMSLPRVFGTRIDTIPADLPYLAAPSDRVAFWRERLASERSDVLKVGVAWAGNPLHQKDRLRSMPAEALFPLGDLPGIAFYSLQKYEPSAQAPSLPAAPKLRDFASELTDFADTAGLVQNLDLVISVDTAVVHLAGALARPVWVMVAAASDWRWLRERCDNPWYPTLKVFRQQTLGNWDGVMRRITQELRSFEGGRS